MITVRSSLGRLAAISSGTSRGASLPEYQGAFVASRIWASVNGLSNCATSAGRPSPERKNETFPPSRGPIAAREAMSEFNIQGPYDEDRGWLENPRMLAELSRYTRTATPDR